jgi:hypothetical protein
MFDAAVALRESPALANYLLSGSAWVAVFIPGIVSLIVVAVYARAGRFSTRLQVLWLCSLPVTLVCTHWDYTDDVHQLYIYSAFSVACIMIFFKRMYIPPPMAYALTFFSLGLVDLTAAFRHAIEWHLPVETFYYGVGGAGIVDALFVVPLFTAAAAAYASARLKNSNPGLVHF